MKAWEEMDDWYFGGTPPPPLPSPPPPRPPATAKDDAQPPTAAGNGAAATDSNKRMKGKIALENIKIPDQELAAAGDQAQSNDPQSSLSPRNYGQMQPTEPFLLSPETESPEVFNLSQKDHAVTNLSSIPPPSFEVDREPVEAETEFIQQIATTPEMDNKPEYCNLQGDEDAGEGDCVEEDGGLVEPVSAPDELNFEPDSLGDSEYLLQTETPQLTRRQKGARKAILDRMLKDLQEKEEEEDERVKHDQCL